MKLRSIFCVILALVLVFGMMPMERVSAEDTGDLVYIHFHDHETEAGERDSIVHTVIVNRGESYGPRPTDVQVSEQSEDNIILVVTGWKDAEGNVYNENNPVQTGDKDRSRLHLS